MNNFLSLNYEKKIIFNINIINDDTTYKTISLQNNDIVEIDYVTEESENTVLKTVKGIINKINDFDGCKISIELDISEQYKSNVIKIYGDCIRDIRKIDINDSPATAYLK